MDDNLHALYTIFPKVLLSSYKEGNLYYFKHKINCRMILPEEDFGTQVQHMIFGNPSFFTEYKQLVTDDHTFFQGILLTQLYCIKCIVRRQGKTL